MKTTHIGVFAGLLLLTSIVGAMAAPTAGAKPPGVKDGAGAGARGGPGSRWTPEQTVDRLLQHLGVTATAPQKAQLIKLAQAQRDAMKKAHDNFVNGVQQTLKLTPDQVAKLKTPMGGFRGAPGPGQAPGKH
jgi:Spy/CpxP family protein refolding chaperone